MKTFLLIAGYRFYPSKGTRDWVKTFETEEDAESYVSKNIELGQSGYKLKNGDEVDWYEIIDLKKWVI